MARRGWWGYTTEGDSLRSSYSVLTGSADRHRQAGGCHVERPAGAAFSSSPSASIHGVWGDPVTLDLSPRPEGRGDAEERSDDAGGRPLVGQLHPTAPLWPAGHLPHAVGESVRERRSHLHPDRDHPRHRASRSHNGSRRTTPTTNRGLRLRGRCRRRRRRGSSKSI
jgi:hypothetical protein